MTDEKVSIFACGPSRPTCVCKCPDGECGHDWSGPAWQSEDGSMGSATCAKCGMTAIGHALWVGP